MDEYVSVRVEPCNAQKYANYASEANRHKVPSYVDKDKLKENRYAGKTLTSDELRDYIADLRKSKNKQNLRKDARLAFAGIITFSHEAQEVFNALDKKEQANIYMDITNAIAKRHNTRALSIALHADETAPHAHFMICAYDRDGNALRLNPKHTSELQDIAGEVLKQHGTTITRGKTIAERLEEARLTGEEPNIKHKTVHELHKTMSTDLKKANKVIKIQQENNRKLLDFNALKKLNLGDILTRFGYIFNRKESSSSTKKYENDTDTLIVKQSSSGDYVYFNSKNERDCGTVIDFAKNRKIDLQTILTATPQPQPVAKTKAAKPAKDEERNLRDDFLKLKLYGNDYLTATRHIKPDLIKRFNVREDKRGNACFPHFNKDFKLTGWEVKNQGFTGFCAGGKRNLGITHIGDDVENIVITESSIDAMSYAQMFEPDNTIYISTGGTLTDKQLQQINALTEQYSATVTAATDNDAHGQLYAERIIDAIPRSTRQTPQKKDWNDDLKQRVGANTARVSHF